MRGGWRDYGVSLFLPIADILRVILNVHLSSVFAYQFLEGADAKSGDKHFSFLFSFSYKVWHVKLGLKKETNH